MELKRYFRMLHRWIWLIALITVLTTLSSAFYSWELAKPKYEATSTILVNQRQSLMTPATSMYDSVMANQALVQTYSDIMESDSILMAVIHQLHLSVTAPQLKKMISVTSTAQSEVINVSVTSLQVQQAANIANALVQNFQERIVSLMAVQNVQVVDPATVPNHPIPVSPHKQKNVVIAFVLGLIIGTAFALTIEYLDDAVRTEEDVRRLLDLPILGTVTKMPVNKLSQQTSMSMMTQPQGG